MTQTQTKTTPKPYAYGPSQGDMDWYGGSLLDWKANAKTTGGPFTLVDQLMRPGNEPPLHIHTREDEAIYLLEGELTVCCGDNLWRGKAGSFFYLPRDVRHSFMIHSEYVRMLILLTPGGMERIYEKNAVKAPERVLPPIPEAGSENYQEMKETLRTELGIELFDYHVRDLIADGAEVIELD